MATPGTCGRRFPDGRLCGNQTPDTHGTYFVVNIDAYAQQLCPACEAEMLLTFLSDARKIEWRSRPPIVTEDGSVWDTGEIRTVLGWAGFEALAGKAGPLNGRALAKLNWLLANIPDLRQRVRDGEVFSEEEMDLIRERVQDNRGR